MDDDKLSRDEINALLAGVDCIMPKEKKPSIHEGQIVLTMYGKNKNITHTSVHLFDRNENDWNDNPANDYCKKINNMIFAGDEWMHAKVIRENEIVELIKPVNIDILLDLDDRTVQKIIREIDLTTLAIALRGIDKDILEKVYKNVSKRMAIMLKEEIEYMGPVRLAHKKEVQEKIIGTILHLQDTGEIIINK